MTALWKQLEDYLFDIDAVGLRFNVHDVALVLDVPTKRASAMIQSYQRAQVRLHSPTLFILYRDEGRTSSAMWKVGVRAVDARRMSSQITDDFRCKLRRDLIPKLHQVGVRNRRAVPAATAMTGLFEASLKVLSTSLDD